MRLCLCFAYIKCGQGCVSVFSLVNVVKRGLISSNVIHIVTSHYFHIPTPLFTSLMPSPPSLLPLSPFISLHHIKKTQPAPCRARPSLRASLAPLHLLILVFFNTFALSHPHITFHHITFLSLSTLSVIVPLPQWTFSVLLPRGASAHQQKEFKISIKMSFNFNWIISISGLACEAKVNLLWPFANCKESNKNKLLALLHRPILNNSILLECELLHSHQSWDMHDTNRELQWNRNLLPK